MEYAQRVAFAVGIACMVVALLGRAYMALRDRRTRKAVTAFALCSDCGEEIRLNEKHVTINRHIEYMDSENSITVLDAEPVATYHPKCAP